MSRVRVKICGLTRGEDVEAALASGADALGVVFARSPRQVDAVEAARLLSRVTGQVLRVGLFMQHSQAEVASVLERVELDLLQFHGDVDNTFCASFGLPFIKAIGVSSGRAAELANRYPDASGILFDAPAPGGAGGTGRTFDWSLLGSIRQPLWLAGGLTAENVRNAIELVGPQWVDVSSGVEVRPGIKSADRIRAFIEAAQSPRSSEETEYQDSEDGN
jgi:phosphoribosylanthranilate isomerase